MPDPPAPDRPPHHPDLTDAQLHALAYLLNDISQHDFQVQPLPDGQWRWQWHDHTGQSPGLSSAVLDALAWYFGLAD